MTQESRIRQLLESTPFPGAGDKLGDLSVKESIVDIQGRNWEIHLEGKHSQSKVKKALRLLTKYPHSVDIDGQFSVLSFKGKGMSHVRTNPPGDLTVVRGHMYYARPNPTTPKVFQEEMEEMITPEPEKFFTVHKATGDKSLKEKLWSFVTYTGESYGWYKDGEIYHRRASIIMPKIKINKALEGATMFYHTHPYKDEPSLTSADDIQFYLDLHFAFGIKTFYTVMKHKMDKFTITGKKGAEAKYLKHDEEKFVDAVDGLIAIGEESSKKNLPDDVPETDHQNHVTRVMVQEFNKKYGSIATIKYTPSVKKNAAKKLARKGPLESLMALSNPRPNPPIVLEDKYVAKALQELQGLDYAFEHYGGDEYAHTMYVYWWLKHHLYPTREYPKGRLFKLQEYGMDQETRGKLREYLNTTVVGNYNYLDVVMLIGLYHDIAKLREQQPGAKPGHIIGAEMFRNEVAPELDLPSKLTEDIAHILESDVGRKGITDDQFLMESGHYYAAAKLMQMADVVTHHPLMFTGSARKAKAEGKIGMASGQKYKDYAMTEIVSDIRDFLDHGDVPRQNPPPRATVVRWVGNYEQSFSMEIVEVNLEEFDYRNVPDKDGRLGEKQGGIGGHLFYMRFNSTTIPSIPEGRVITANLALNTGNLLVTIGSPVPQDDLGKQIANDIYNEVGMQLKESYPELVIEEPEPEMLVNPVLSKKIQLITLSGPSGVGKSTVLNFLANNLPNASTPPTYTTRPRRPTDGQDRVHISREEFMDGVQRGEFVEWEPSGSGHLYGKKFKDFTGSVAIIDVTIGGKRKYAKAFPNMFSIFLDPDPNVTVAQRAKKLYQRGGMSKEEAKKRASIAHSMVQASKKMDFDLRIVMKHGDYEKNAQRILGEIPLNNPNLGDFGDIGETPEERAERELRLAAVKARIEAEEEEANRERNEREARLVDDPMSEHLGQTLEEREAEEQARLDRKQAEAQQRAEEEERNRASTARLDAFENPKDLFDWFYDWVHLVNMKNKELKAFLDSDWGKVAGLSKQEAKDWNNIKSGRVSGRRILKMRKKLGLTGPKDYIKLGPRIIENYYAKAIDNWTGPSNDMQKGETDWDWCKRQVRFNKRFMGDNFGKRKGSLVKKQKTQNQPSRRLLALWVWGHDPWRYARKVEKRAKMPKCPDVPWVGMTEKRKYGKIPVIMSPRVRSNPEVQLKRTPYRSYFLDSETGEDLTGIPFGKVLFKKGKKTALFEKKMTREEANKPRAGKWYRVNIAAQPGKVPIVEVAELFFVEAKNAITHRKEGYDYNHFKVGKRAYFDNFEIEGPVYPTVLSQMDIEPSSVLLVKGDLNFGERLGTRRDVTDWEGETKGSAPHFKSGSIKSRDRKRTHVATFAPEGDKMRMDLHIRNFTKKTVENQGTITISDEGDHYFLHSVQVAPKFRGQGILTDLIGFLFLEMPDRLPGHPKKPVRTLVRAVEGIPQKKLVELFEQRFGFRPLEEVDDGVLMEFKWPSDGTVIRDNPGFRDPETGTRVVILDENLPSKKYHGTTDLPYRLPYGLVKGLRSLLAREREYVGFVKNNRIYYSTSFEKYSTTSQYSYDNLNGALLRFHTHPYGYRKGMQGMVSPGDLAAAIRVRAYAGLTWGQVVVQKRGINFIATTIKKNSPLHTAIKANDGDKAIAEVEKDAEKLYNIYKGKSLLKFTDNAGVGHPHWHAITEYGQEKALIETANEIMTNFEFFMYYLEVPVILPDWKKGVTEDFTLEGKKFEDVIEKLEPGVYKQIRSNPHYTPPPNIAMFPGEMPMGPAALYQQTISPSALTNGRRRPKNLTKHYKKARTRTNHNYCTNSGGKQIFPDRISCLRDINRQRANDATLPDLYPYGPCQYCGGWHKTRQVRSNPTARELYDMMPFEEIGAVVSAVGLVGTVGKFVYEYIQAKRRRKRESEVDARLDNIVNAFNSLEAQLNLGGVSRTEVEAELERQIPDNIRKEVHEDLSERMSEANTFAKEEKRINDLMAIHPDKPSRVGLFIGAYGHEAHVAEMCKELEVAYIVDPQPFDVSKSKGNMKNWQSFKMVHFPGELEYFLKLYGTTSNKEPFSLVHFPHRGFRGDVTEILPYCTEATIFAGGISADETFEGATHVPMTHNAMPAVTRETRELLKPPPPPPPPPPTTPPTSGISLDDLPGERPRPPKRYPNARLVYTGSVAPFAFDFSGRVRNMVETWPSSALVIIEDRGGLLNPLLLLPDKLPLARVYHPQWQDYQGSLDYDYNNPEINVWVDDNGVTPNLRKRLEGLLSAFTIGERYKRNNFSLTPEEQAYADELNRRYWGDDGPFTNPRTKKGRKFPKKYLKNLTPTEKAIAMYEIDRGYEYDEDDPEAYKFWESDIKSKARGLKTVPSKWRNKFAKKYGPLKEGKDFLTRISKTTGIKRSILKKIYDKGLAAWRVGHRPGVQQHQWAAGRVYAFVMGANSSTGPGKPDHKLAVEAGVR